MTEYKTSFKRLFGCLLISFLTIHFSGCDSIISSVGELPDEVPGPTNPNDPDNPNYVDIPDVILMTGTFDEAFIIHENDLELRWEPSHFDSGIQYRFKLAGPSESLDDVDWGAYLFETSIYLPELVETFNNESYDFAIEVSSTNEPHITPKVFEGSFQVDAQHEKALLFRPSVIERNNDGTFTAQIYIDEIQEYDDMIALSLEVEFNSNELDVTDILVYDDQRSFLFDEGGEVISFIKVEDNQITIEAGVAGNNSPLVGGGGICEITFTPRYYVSNSYVTISTSSILKSSQGFDVELSLLDQAILVQ